MNSGYLDKDLIQNSSLACYLLTIFVKQYENLTANTEKPEVLKLLLVLPFVWHKNSRDAIKNRNFSSSIRTVLDDSPLIKLHLQSRITDFAPVALQGINLGCATGLLTLFDINDKPRVSSSLTRWPQGAKPTEVPSDMTRVIDRLAAWYSQYSTADLYAEILGTLQ